MSFNDGLHEMVPSGDGSYTAYSVAYGEHYHSTKDGALHESLCKHVIPAFMLKKSQDTITILDICFGLGFNTLATLYYHKLHKLDSKIAIYSPELDEALVSSLKDFVYPKEFDWMREIIESLSQKREYQNEHWHVKVIMGDARAIIKEFSHAEFDVVYQDAFSPSANPLLWTSEYFSDIRRVMKDDGVLTTYSTALATRLALYENGFKIYLNCGEGYRNATIASPQEIDELERVDMAHKIACNPGAKALRD